MNILTEKQRKQVLENDPALTTLVLKYWDLNDVREFVQQFCQINNKHVTTLSFYDSVLNNELLQVLSGLTGTCISTLSLSLSDPMSEITNEGVTHLTALTGLKDLTLSGSLTPSCLSELAEKLPRLRTLEIYSPTLTPADPSLFLKTYPALQVYLNGEDCPLHLQESALRGKNDLGFFSQTGSLSFQHVDTKHILECIFNSFLEADSQHRREEWIEALAKRVNRHVVGSFFQSVKAVEPSILPEVLQKQ